MSLTILAATLLLVGANIHTLENDRPRAEALVARDGVIVYVGSEAEARARAGAGAREMNLRGKTVLPGFTDAHGHLGGLGALERGALDLRDAKTFDEVIEAVKDEVKKRKPGEWILGSRWDHESWPGRELPMHHQLSDVARGNPVWLDRVDGHMGIANRAAMERAGITGETPSPAGGSILHDATGKPSGIFVDNAMELVTKFIPAGARGSYGDLVLAAQARCFAVGLTTVHDAGIEPSEIQTLQGLADEGRLKLQVYAMVAASQAGLEWIEGNRPIVGYGADHQLTVRTVKLFADGALGSRGAWLLAPYADRPLDDGANPYFGLPVTPPDTLRKQVAAAMSRGYQVATHAIGDRGNRETLDAYEAAARSYAPRTLEALRARIEHAQVLSAQDVPRFARLGVIASMQPTHATSDMRWADRRIGVERLRGSYAWASLLRSGARLAFGSDFPVEAPDPLAGIHAAVTRQDAHGEPIGGWNASERVTRMEAVRGFTEWAAYAAFEENVKGTLAVGKRADLVVLSRDILTCEPAEILTTRIEMTLVGGEVVFSAR